MASAAVSCFEDAVPACRATGRRWHGMHSNTDHDLGHIRRGNGQYTLSEDCSLLVSGKGHLDRNHANTAAGMPRITA
jgi:hypothetical protein